MVAPITTVAVLTAFGIAVGMAVGVPGAQAQDTVPVRAIAVPARPMASEAASAKVTRFSFIVYGDTRGPRDGIELHDVHAHIVESMLQTIRRLKGGPDPVRFVIQSGDAVVRGSSAQQWNVSFVPIVDRLATEGGVPYFLAPGNHDVSSADTVGAPSRAPGLRNFYDALAKIIPPNGSPHRLRDYPAYSFAYGNTYVIAFDSNIAGDTVQFAWVKSQLEHVDRRRYRHIVIFCHHPAFSSASHGGPTVERPTVAIREKYMPLFRANGVDMMFVGHEHEFEHWVETWKDTRGATHRLDQVVTGGGGAPLYVYRGEPDLTSYLAAGAAQSLQVTHLVRPAADTTGNPHHYVVVHVDGARVWQEVIGVDWGADFAPYRTNRADIARPDER
jgi:3',5'-cyclic AMP phosphodiesterase CpdA